MMSSPIDQQLLMRLKTFSELAASGFSVRQGLAGGGVTVLHGQTYFGSWRVSQNDLVFVSANMSDPHVVARSVDDAVWRTLLLVLRTLEAGRWPHSMRAAS